MGKKEKRLVKPLQKVLYFFYLENVVFVEQINVTTDTTWLMSSLSEGQKIAEGRPLHIFTMSRERNKKSLAENK